MDTLFGRVGRVHGVLIFFFFRLVFLVVLCSTSRIILLNYSIRTCQSSYFRNSIESTEVSKIYSDSIILQVL